MVTRSRLVILRQRSGTPARVYKKQESVSRSLSNVLPTNATSESWLLAKRSKRFNSSSTSSIGKLLVPRTRQEDFGRASHREKSKLRSGNRDLWSSRTI